MTFQAIKLSLMSRLGLAVLAATSASHASAQDSLHFSDQQIVDFYEEIAFGSEFDEFLLGNGHDRIIKRNPVSVTNIITIAQPSVPVAEAAALVASVVDDLREHSSGLELKTYSPDELTTLLTKEPDVVEGVYANSTLVYLGSRNELISIARTMGENSPEIANLTERLADVSTRSDLPFCTVLGLVPKEGGNIIGLSVALVEYDSDTADTVSCLYEEIMQSFGLPNDFAQGTRSIFNDDGVYRLPTDLDWQMWRIHTNDLITPGMAPDEVRDVVMDILESEKG